MDLLLTFSCGALGVAFGVLLLFALLRQFILVCPPNEIMIFSGRKRTLEDGSEVGYRVVAGGLAFRVPLLERVDGMDLSTMPLDLNVANAYSKGGIPLNVHAIANVKVSSGKGVVTNAIERFLGRDPQEIRRVAKESLEGHLRGVLATLTPEEVNEDRLKFAHALVDEAEDDLHKLGLQLDTLVVQNVFDDVKYLDSIGRQQIANVVMVADIAESNAKAEADQAEAHASQQAQVVQQQAETTIVQRENEMRRLKAELEFRAKAEEERTTQLAAEARANAEQKLQELRQQVESARLTAEVVLPARAQQEAAARAARGEASAIAENGRAAAEVLRQLAAVLAKAGPSARDVFVMQQIEPLIGAVVEPLRQLSVGEVSLVDSGDGRALAAYLSSYPAAVNAILDEIKKTTGVDVRGAMAGTEVR